MRYKDKTLTMELTLNSAATKAVTLLGMAGLLLAFTGTYSLIETVVQGPWWECWPQALMILSGFNVFRVSASGRHL